MLSVAEIQLPASFKLNEKWVFFPVISIPEQVKQHFGVGSHTLFLIIIFFSLGKIFSNTKGELGKKREADNSELSLLSLSLFNGIGEV